MYSQHFVFLLASLFLSDLVLAQHDSPESRKASTPLQTLQWTPLDIELEASSSHAWWEFPVTATFHHAASDLRLTLEGFFNGEKRYVVRFAAPLAGTWKYETASQDLGLANRSGQIEVSQPNSAELDGNPNLRGHLQVASSGRYFEHADGTPFLLLADTNWSINTQRCGLGENGDGPFYQYLADRKSKGFSLILMSFMHGFGDTREPAGQRNEGGYPFPGGDVQQLNAAYFEALDQRLGAVWQAGLAVGAHPTWFGKLNCFFGFESATRISSYLAVRYGAYNALWSLSGEYQYAMKDCQWTEEQFSELGRAVAAHNPYQHPLSIHPSGRTDWPAPHNRQSSIAFNNSTWLDHHWLQTGQKSPDILLIPVRLAEVRALTPTRPAFLAESFYERASDEEHAYHTRWQCWTAMLSGAAGYGYGAFGVWNFYDPNDPNGETGKFTVETIPWTQAWQLQGSSQIGAAHQLLSSLPWWQLSPTRCKVSASDISPSNVALLMTAIIASPDDCSASETTMPVGAHSPNGDWIVYFPRNEHQCELRLGDHGEFEATGPEAAYWYNPRSAERISVVPSQFDNRTGVILATPTNDDWVFVLERGFRRSGSRQEFR